jgi:hypothetical protein
MKPCPISIFNLHFDPSSTDQQISEAHESWVVPDSGCCSKIIHEERYVLFMVTIYIYIWFTMFKAIPERGF